MVQIREVNLNVQRIVDAQHKDDLAEQKRLEELFKSSEVEMIHVRREHLLIPIRFFLT